MKSRKYSAGILLSSLFLILSFTATAGTIKGHVRDSLSKENLTGATVYLKENNQLNDGVGLEGSYAIKNVPAGTYTVVVQFFGYTQLEKTVTLTDAQQTVTIDFAMSSQAQTLGQINVVGNYDQGSDNYARSAEKTSDYLLNIVSAKTMLLLPDITVGDVLQRVSGIVTQKSVTGGGKYVVIRGMDKRYSYVTVNGVKVASPDYENKYVPLDLFPSGMLDRLEVIKTLRPDMEGDAVGGVMNLVLKNPPLDYKIIDAELSGGYAQNLFSNNFNGINASAINAKSPEAINGTSYVATPNDFPTQPFIYNIGKAAPSFTTGATFGERFLNNKLGLIVSAFYQNTYTQTNAFFTTPDPQPGTNNGPNTPVFDDVQNRVYSTQQTREAGHLKLDYDFNKKNKISFYAMYVGMNQLRSDFKSTQTLGTGSGASDLAQDYETKVTDQSIFNASLNGQDSLLHNLYLDWTANYSRGFSNTPDWGDLTTEDQNGGATYYYKGWGGKWWQNTDDNYTGYINLTYKVKLFGQDVKFKVGAMNRDKTRNDLYEDYSLSVITPYTYVYSPTSLNQNIWSIAGSEYGSPGDANNYNVQEDVTAVYGMVNFNVGDKWEVMGGLRGENTSLAFHDPLPIDVAADSGTIQYFDWLPSVEVKYNITPKQSIRASFFQSITRPSFEELMPYSIAGDYYTEEGNPYLLHSQAYNYDLRYEFFPTASEEILAGVFYKNIIDPIEYSLQRFKTSSQYLQPVNDTNSAFAYGFEFVVAKYIKDFGVSANYSYTKSQTTVPTVYYYTTPSGSQTNEIMNETRPLQGQASNIANLSLLYKNSKIGLDLNLSGVYTGKLIYATSLNYDMDLWQMPQFRLDFSFQKKISKKYKLSVFGKINNILNTPLVIMQYPPSPYSNSGSAGYIPNQSGTGLISSILQEKETYGQFYTLGVRYKF